MKTWLAQLCGALLITATAYSATPGHRITASGARVRPGFVAVSRDLRNLMGQTVTLHGLGRFRVADLMHHRFRRRVDIYLSSTAAAKKFGKQRLTLLIH